MEVDQLPDGRPLAQLSLAEIKEQCALRNLPKNGSRKDLTDRLKLRLELEKLREEASRALAKEDVVPNIGLQDTPVGQSDIVRQYLEAQQRRLLLFGVHRPHFENTTPIQETTPSDERKRPVAQKTKGSLKQSDLLGTTPGATRDLLANADGLLDDLEETTSSIKATRGRSANHKLKTDETPSRKKTRYNSNDATNSISRAPEEPTPLTAKRRRVVRGSPVQADVQQTPTAPIEFAPLATETKEVKRGRGRPRKIKENPPAIVLSSPTVAAQDGLTDPKVDLSASAQAQPAVKANVDKKPIVLASEKEENRSARAKRLRSQEETPQTLQERARVPTPANSADPAPSEVSLEDPIEAALLAMHGAENATKSPKRRSLPLELLDDERSRAQESEESDSSQANISVDGPVELASSKTQLVDVLENGDMLPRSAAATDPSAAETTANRERSKVAKPARSKDASVAKEASKVVAHRAELLEGKESKEVFAKKSTPIPGSPRQEVKRTGGNERTVRETRKRTKVENIVQKLVQDKVEAADIAAKEASLAKRPRKENGQTDNSKVPDSSPPSSGISPDDCVLRLLGAGPKLEKADKRTQDTPKTTKEKKPASGSPRDKRAKDVVPTSLSSPTSRRSRRGLSGEGVDAKSEPDVDAAAATDPAESGRRDSVEAAVAALIGEPLEPRPAEDASSKRATRKTSRDMKAADEHQQQNLHQQSQEQQQQSLPAAVSQPSTRSSRSLRSRETSTEAETVVTNCPRVSPLREEQKPEQKAPVDKASEASTQDEPEVKPTPAVEISQAIVEGPVPSKLEQAVAKCETRRTSARQNSSESKQSKIVEHIKVEQSIKLDAAVADSPAAKREPTATSAGKSLESATSPRLDEGTSTEQKAAPASTVSELSRAEEPPTEKEDETTIADSERDNVRSLLEQTTHNSAIATVASSSTELGTKPVASEKTTQNDETDEDLDALKIVENDEQPDAQESQKTECVVGDVEEKNCSEEEIAKDLREALPTKDHKSVELAEAATGNLEGKGTDEKKTDDCAAVEKAPETESSEQFSTLLEGNKDIASDIEQEVSSKPQPEQDDLWEAVFCGDQEGNPSADWPEGNNNEDPSSSYRQSDLLDDSETNISDTPGIKLPHKFQPNVESAVASILDLNDVMRPSSSLSSHGGQHENETAVMDNVPDADSAVAGLLSEVPFDDEGDHADLCIDDEVVSEAVPQEYEYATAECSAEVFDQEPNPRAVGVALQEISTCKETPERRISEEVRSVTGDVVESVATASLLVDVTEQQQRTTSFPRGTEQTSSAPLGACSPQAGATETRPTVPPPISPPLSVAIEKPSDVKGSVNLSEESSSDSDSEDSSVRNKSRVKQKERPPEQIASNAKLESESSKRKTPVSHTSNASASRKPSSDSRKGKQSSSSSSSSSSGPSSSESSSSDEDDAGRGNTETRKATSKSLAAKKKQPSLNLKSEKRPKQKDPTHKEDGSESLKVQSEEKLSQPERDQSRENQESAAEKSRVQHEKHAEAPQKQKGETTGSCSRDDDKKRLREQQEDQEKLRREREAAEAVQKELEAEEMRKQSEAAEKALKQLEEAEKARKQLEEEQETKKRLEEEDRARNQLEEQEKVRKQLEEQEGARKQLEEEERARKQLEEEEKARKQLEEEEKARKQLEEEERARKQLEEEEKARKQLEEEERTRKLLEEEERTRKQLEEEERTRKQLEEEERSRKQLEEEERSRKQREEEERTRKQLEEEEKAQKEREEMEKAKKQREEEEKTRKQHEEAERVKKQQEEEKARKLQEEETARKQQEEEKARKLLEEEKSRKRLEEERAKEQKEKDEELRRQEEVEKLRKQEQEAEKLREKKEEEDLRRQKAAEQARLREEEAATSRKQKEEEELRKQKEEEERAGRLKEEEEKSRREEEKNRRQQEQVEERSKSLKEEESQKKRDEEERLLREVEAANLQKQQAVEEQRVREEAAEKERREKEEELRKQEGEEKVQNKQQEEESSREQQLEVESLLSRPAAGGRDDQRAESVGAENLPGQGAESQQDLGREEPKHGAADQGAAIEPDVEASCSAESSAAKASTSSDDLEKAGDQARRRTESNQDPVASGMMLGSNSQQRKNPLVSYGFDSEDDEDDDDNDEGSDEGHQVANASEAVAKDSNSKGDGGNSGHEEVPDAPPRSPVERCQDAAQSSADYVGVDVSAAKAEDSGGVQVSSSHTTGVFTHSVASPGMVGGLKKFEVTSSSDNSAERRPEVGDNRAEASSGLEGESSADEVCDIDHGLPAPNDCLEAANQAETASSSDESARSLDESSQNRLHSQSVESASSSAEMTSSTDRSKNQNPQDGASSSSDSAARAAPDEADQKTCVASSEHLSQQPSSDDACSSSDKLPKADHDDPAADTSTSCQDLRTEVQSSSEAGSEKLHDASSSSDKKESTDSYADSSSPQHTMTTSNDRVESRTDGEGAPSSSDQQTGTADSRIENSAEEPDSEPVRASVESSEEASSPDYGSVDASDDPTLPKCCSSSTASTERCSGPVEEFESGRPRCESTSETNRAARLDDDDDFEENSQPELPGACTSSHSQQHSNQHAVSEQADPLSNAADEDIDISSSNNNNNTNNSSNPGSSSSNNNSSSSNANNPATSEASSAEVDAAKDPLPVEKTPISSSDAQPSQRSADFSLDESSGMAQSSDEPRAQMLASPLQDYGAVPDGNEVSASSSSSSATGENQVNTSSSGDKDSPAPTPSSSGFKPDVKLSSSSSVEDASSEAIPMGVEHSKDVEEPTAESPAGEENADSSQEDENPSSSSAGPSNKESKEPSSN